LWENNYARTPRVSQNDGDDSRCWSSFRSRSPLSLRGYGRVGDFRSEFFSVRFEPTRLRLTNFRKSGRDRPKHIVSTITYNGQFPGPLLRFKEGQPATVEVHNDTDTPEQLHWHGQMVSTDVDGAAEEGTPFIPAQRNASNCVHSASIRFSFLSHAQSGGRRSLHAGQYSGQVGPVYIEPKHEAGSYDREVFLVLKEFEPSFSQGGDMAQDFLAPSTRVKELESSGESAMKASLAKGMPHGYEVGYRYFTDQWSHAGTWRAGSKVKQGERVLFHVLNGSATEIRSLALPGHTFKVVALDGNAVPTPAEIPVLWLGTAERISAIVEMNHPGVWIMGDLADDDRGHGMGLSWNMRDTKESRSWIPPKPFHWDYLRFAKGGATALSPDETFEMTFAKTTPPKKVSTDGRLTE
jgi:FtsP/CotA-like multicopper oxidase with cupredoxin domain